MLAAAVQDAGYKPGPIDRLDTSGPRDSDLLDYRLPVDGMTCADCERYVSEALGFAFGLGMAAAVNPCGFALLPSYLGLYLGTAAGERLQWPAQLRRALAVSAAMTISFVALFGAAGLILGGVGAAVGGWLPWLSLGTGVVLAMLGGRLLAGGSVEAPGAERLADRLGGAVNRTGLLAYAAYGLAFALSSLGCTLPLFLTVVGTGVARGGLA